MRPKTIIAFALLAGLTAGCEERQEPTEQQRTEPGEGKVGQLEERAREALDEGKEEGKREAKQAEQKAEEHMGAANGAMSHLPAGCEVVARIEMSKLVKLPGAKEHLIPAIDQTATKSESQMGQINSLLEEIDVEPTKDVEEIAMCATELPQKGQLQATNVIVAVTGKIPKDKLVPSILERSANGVKAVEIENVKAAHDEKRNLFVGQTEDGTVIAARTREGFANAVNGKAGTGDYQLSEDKAASILVPADTISRLLKMTDDKGLQVLLQDAERAIIDLDAEGTTLTVRVDMPNEKAAQEVGGMVKTGIADMQKREPAGGVFNRSLQKAEVRYEGATTVVNVPVPKDQVENLMRELANEVRTSMN